MKTKIFLFSLVAVILSSCAGFTNVTAPESNVNFVGRDTEIIRMVTFTLPKTYVFGIGGMSPRARNTNIMDELMKRAQLQPNETLAYITYSDNKNNYLGVVTKVRITATGYVVRLTPRAKEGGNTPVTENVTATNTASPTRTYDNSAYNEIKVQKEPKPFNKRKGYFGLIEAGYGFEFIGWENMISAKVIQGYRVSPLFGVGFGVGFNNNFDDNFSIPLFVHLRSEFLERGTTPFASLNFGYNILVNECEYYHWNGIYAEPAVGMSMNLGRSCRFNASVGLTMGRTTSKYTYSSILPHYDGSNSYYEERKLFLDSQFGIAPTIKIGFEF